MGVARAPKRRFFGDCGIRTVAALAFLLLAGCHSVSTRAPDPVSNPSPERAATFEAPRIPSPDPTSAQVPAGYRVDIVATGLTYPSSVEFDDQGMMYVAEAGFVFGDGAAVARVVRIDTAGHIELVADQLNAPITDLLWHGGRLYISHRGKISVLIGSRVQDIVTGLPSFGDYQNNQLSVGPDGKLYLGQGTVSNSGVVGADNFAYGWLAKHPEAHDVPARPLELMEQSRFRSLNPLKFTHSSQPGAVDTGPFQPFGKWGAARIEGTVKANGTILRFNPDGSELEMYAWGLRNPFGVAWGLDGVLYASEDGYDERGSRPIANAPDSIWQIKRGNWYGFPDFGGGIPVNDVRMRPASGEAVQFVLKVHPRRVEQPLVRLPSHSGVAKIDFSRNSQFGFEGQMFVAEVGDFEPITGKGKRPNGYQVVRIDPITGETTSFLKARADRLGPIGLEYVTTSGPKRPVDVCFSRDGDALYVADLGAIMSSSSGTPRPFAGTGVIWRISRDDATLKFPIGISFFPGKANEAVGGSGSVVGTSSGEAKSVTKND